MSNNQEESINCFTDEHHQYLLNTDPGYRVANETITSINKVASGSANLYKGPFYIPVVVHVVYNANDLSQKLDFSQIQSQIDVLNDSYNARNADIIKTPSCWSDRIGNPNITFFLTQRDPNGEATTGVVYCETTKAAFSFDTAALRDQVKYSAKGGSDPWDTTRYLNIWVCNITSGGDATLGYTQFPGAAKETDGVIINYKYFGTNATARFNLGRTAVHEVGHWLDLRHIWGDKKDCSGDDGIADTPPCWKRNIGKPTFPHITCKNGPNGDMFCNYMDNTDDDITIMFTKGQAERMWVTLNTTRKTVWSSTFSGLLVTNATKFEAGKANTKFMLSGTSRNASSDLVGVKTAASEGTAVTLVSASAVSDYQQGFEKEVSMDPTFGTGSCEYALVHWAKEVKDSSFPDLLVVNKNGQKTNSTEVQIFAGSSDHQLALREDIRTCLPPTDENWTFLAADMNGDRYPDLIAIKKSNTANKKVQLRVLAGASGYGTVLVECDTVLEESEDPLDFQLADWNGDGSLDLVVIIKSIDCCKRTRIEVLAGSSNYQEYLLRTDTALLKTSEMFDFALADWTGDGRPDLIAIKKDETGSGKVEIQVFAG